MKQYNFGFALAALVIATCLCLAGIIQYQNNYITIGGDIFEKASEQLDLCGQELEDIEILQAFSDLKCIDLRDTGLTCEEYDRIKSWFPDARILWDVPFQNGYIPMDTEELTITSLSESDLALLPYFTSLCTVRAEECPDYLVLDALRQRRPDLELHYCVPVLGTALNYDTEAVVVPGDDVEELFAALPMLPELREVELQAPLAPAERIMALRETFPQIRFSWDLELAGMSVNESTETLDLTGIPLTVEQMDAILPYLPDLTYVDMTDCGISNEEMDALNARYENIKIVWTVTLGKWYRTKTDITAFMPVKDDFYPSGNDLYNLRYCHDLIAVDIGHRGVTNCQWAAYMPHLKYLIIADTYITDLTPLTGLKELVYLEVFMTSIRDFSPLVTLTGLEDLNLCYTRGDPEIIAQMTWLKNLWWGYWEKVDLSNSTMNMLRDALPDCNCCFMTQSSTGMGWRELPNYYAQRDAFGVHYMAG